MLLAFKVGLPRRSSEKNGQKGRVRSQPSLLSSPCLRRLPQKCGALRLKPWSAAQRQTPRWSKPDSNLYGAFPVKWSFLVFAGSLFGAGKPFFVPSPAIRFAERAEGVKGPKR